MPGPGRKRAPAVVAVAALAEVVTLPEQVAVIGIVQRTDLQERSRAGRGLVHDENIHDERVLIHQGAASIRRNPVVHDVANVAVEIARDRHHGGRFAADVRNPQGGGGAKRGPLRGQAGRAIEILEGQADGGRQTTAVEIPLAGHGIDGAAAGGNRKLPFAGLGQTV